MKPEKREDFTKSKSYISETFIKGVLVLLPITLVIILLSVIFNFIFGIITPLSSVIDPGADDPHWLVNILSLAILLLFVFMMGVIIKNRFGRTYFRKIETKYLKKIPLYNVIYETVYQFVGIKELPFSEVVLVDPFNSGTLMTGFITDKSSEKLYTVFVPTAPNPTNGNIYHVPRKSITHVAVTPQEAMKTIVSMGAGSSKISSLLQDDPIDNA